MKKPSSKLATAVVLVGHGSRARGFDTALRRVAQRLRRTSPPGEAVACAYLEIAPPALPEVIDELVRRGARRVSVVPYFLQAGLHVRRDIPAAVRAARSRYRGRAVIALKPYLGYDARIAAVVRDRLTSGGAR